MNRSMGWLMLVVFLGATGCDSASSKPAPSATSSAPETPQEVSQNKTGAASKKVTLLRTPDGGIQPQAVMDKGVLHLIFFKGDPKHGDVFYVKSSDDGQSFSKPLRVNSLPDSAVAMGNVRGAHLAVGAGGRAHVAWMGSMKTAPKGDHHAAPMLYARLNDDGSAFEPQRNLIQAAYGLDGGGSVAADGKQVVVAWHAPTPGAKGEDNRRVWLVASNDEGKTFGKESPISPADSGSCGCCGMRVFLTPTGQALALFRGARETSHRPMYLLAGDATGAFRPFKLHEWETGVCPMSTMAFATSDGLVAAAWETEGQTFYTRMQDGAPAKPIASPSKSNRQHHPALATNGREVLLAWTEGMGWNKGGALAWQTFDAKDQPIVNAKQADYGRADGVPVWSVITAVTLKDGRFAIIY